MFYSTFEKKKYRRLCHDDVLEEILKMIIIRDHNKLKKSY